MLNCLKEKKELFKWGEINLTFCTIESLSLEIKNLNYFSYFFNLNMKFYFFEFKNKVHQILGKRSFWVDIKAESVYYIIYIVIREL